MLKLSTEDKNLYYYYFRCAVALYEAGEIGRKEIASKTAEFWENDEMIMKEVNK